MKKLKPTAKRPRALATNSNGLSPLELNIITENVTAEVSSKVEAFFEKFRQPTSNDKDKNDQGNTHTVEKAVQERVDNITDHLQGNEECKANDANNSLDVLVTKPIAFKQNYLKSQSKFISAPCKLEQMYPIN